MFFPKFELKIYIVKSKTFTMKKTDKELYESPRSKILIVEIQGIVCKSQTETVDDDEEEIEW